MQATRNQILNYLQNHPPSSAGEIARYLQMTSANIRYHLGILKTEGAVTDVGQRPAGGAGRPILLYTLASNSLGDNLVPLLSGLLTALERDKDQNPTLDQLVEILIPDQWGKTRNRIQRFNKAVAFLNSKHYHASWEARPQGPRVILRHCPYQHLAQTHPILCRMDERLLSRIFGTKLELTQKRNFGKNPFSPCVFHTTLAAEKKGSID